MSDNMTKSEKIEVVSFIVFLVLSLLALVLLIGLSHRYTGKCKVSAQPDLREHCKTVEMNNGVSKEK